MTKPTIETLEHSLQQHKQQQELKEIALSYLDELVEVVMKSEKAETFKKFPRPTQRFLVLCAVGALGMGVPEKRQAIMRTAELLFSDLLVEMFLVGENLEALMQEGVRLARENMSESTKE